MWNDAVRLAMSKGKRLQTSGAAFFVLGTSDVPGCCGVMPGAGRRFERPGRSPWHRDASGPKVGIVKG